MYVVVSYESDLVWLIQYIVVALIIGLMCQELSVFYMDAVNGPLATNIEERVSNRPKL